LPSDDGRVYVTIDGDTGDVFLLIAGWQNANNYYYGKAEQLNDPALFPPNHRISFWKVSGGVHTQIGPTLDSTFGSAEMRICWGKGGGYFTCGRTINWTGEDLGGKFGVGTEYTFSEVAFDDFAANLRGDPPGNAPKCPSCPTCEEYCNGDMPDTVEVTFPEIDGGDDCTPCSALSGMTFVLTRTDGYGDRPATCVEGWTALQCNYYLETEGYCPGGYNFPVYIRADVLISLTGEFMGWRVQADAVWSPTSIYFWYYQANYDPYSDHWPFHDSQPCTGRTVTLHNNVDVTSNYCAVDPTIFLSKCTTDPTSTMTLVT
jgi:hypothetical protein